MRTAILSLFAFFALAGCATNRNVALRSDIAELQPLADTSPTNKLLGAALPLQQIKGGDAVTIEDCRKWLSRRKTAGMFAAAGAAVAGAGGLGSAFPSDQSTRLYISGPSLLVAVFSAGSAYLAKSDGDDFNTYCLEK